jgi:RNA polymerase sigma-70 factor (ECF subfamily)
MPVQQGLHHLGARPLAGEGDPMFTRDADVQRGFEALRAAVLEFLSPTPAVALAGAYAASPRRAPSRTHWLLTETIEAGAPRFDGGASNEGVAASSEADQAEATRLIALVDLARGGDTEAFGMLYDHYNQSVYRFVYYRVGSVSLAEDLTSETFFRALRSMGSFRWQGKDFGAWLMTIARNLTADHYKSSRTRLEMTTEDMTPHDSATEGPEGSVLATLTNETLLVALKALPAEQQECLIMRFLQGLSIAETAAVLGRSEGAIKQLQLRGVRNLAKALPEDLR